jgi:peptidyl-prolyl cis-trans isomerase C
MQHRQLKIRSMSFYTPSTSWSGRLAAALLLISPALMAQTPAAPKPEALVTINGKAISPSLLEQLVAASKSQGQPDTPELRRALLDELISRELVAQDALAKKLDKTPQGRLQLQQARQNVLIDLAMAQYFAKHPIDEAALRTEYQRQTSALQAMGSTQQYQLRLLVAPTEGQAREAIRLIQKGQSMEGVVKELSTDPSRENGGLMDWLLPNQMLPSIANVVVNLSRGQVTAAPIQTPAGWNVLRVEDVRPFVVPKFEESIAQLRNALVTQRRAAYLAELRSAAKITRP